MVANHCQSEKIKIKNKIKAENKKNVKKYYSEKNPTKLSWPMRAKSDNFFLFKKKKKHKITMTHKCHMWYLVTMPYMSWSKDFFGSSLKTFQLRITILVVGKLIDKVEEINKNIRTWGCGTSHFEAGVTNFYFLQEKYFANFFFFFFSYCSHEWPRMFPHTCALLRCLVFYKKRFFCKTNNIFYSLKNQKMILKVN